MATEGGAVGSTYFEVRFDDVPPETPKPEKPKEPTGGMSFSVGLGKIIYYQRHSLSEKT